MVYQTTQHKTKRVVLSMIQKASEDNKVIVTKPNRKKRRAVKKAEEKTIIEAIKNRLKAKPEDGEAVEKCISAQVHERSFPCELMKHINFNETIINQIDDLTCSPCYNAIYNRYSKDVNDGKIDWRFEAYFDTQVMDSLDSIKSLMRCDHNLVDEETIKKFDDIVEDYKAHIQEKRYTIQPRNEYERLELIKSQGLEIKNVKDGIAKYEIILPPCRTTLIPQELEAILGLSTSKTLPTVKGAKSFIVYEDSD